MLAVGTMEQTAMKQTTQKIRGNTMMEMLFAILLVGVCAVILMASMPVATTSREKAELHNRAMALAQKELEAIRGLGYANINASTLASRGLIDNTTAVATNTYTFTNVDSTALDNPARILPSGQGFVIVEQADLDLRRVTVYVQWTTGGQTYEYRIGTLVANL